MLAHLRKDDDGVVTIIVAVFVVVLFGFMALAIDVARLYLEKEQLQQAADLSALAGSQFLWKGEADAETAGELFVTNNPSVNHPGAYNESGGDLVDAKRQAEGTGCGANVDGTSGKVTLDPTLSITGSEYYDCVETTVTAPAFDFLFASVLGYQPRTLSAKSTSFMGNGAPKGSTIIPWLLRDCPNAEMYPEEAGVVVPECPYYFTDSFVNDPSSPYITEFEENANFVGARMSKESTGCPLQDGYDGAADGGAAEYRAFNEGASTHSVCRVAPGLRFLTRGGNLGAQLAGWLETRGISTTTCANATAFNTALGKTGDGDGFVSIKERNACLLNVAFVTYAAPTSRVATVDDNVAGTPAGMQALVTEPGSTEDRFEGLKNNVRVVVRRLAWFYITGFNNNVPIGVYLRAIDNDNSILVGNMDKCPATTPIAQCAQHGIYIVKLVN